MVKSLLVDDHVHKGIINLQKDILETHKVKVNISLLIEEAFKNPDEIKNRIFESKEVNQNEPSTNK